MTRMGFSTGALAYGDFRRALELVRSSQVSAIELSALRLRELPALVDALPALDLARFSYVAVHAPSSFTEAEEKTVIAKLGQVPPSYPIVLHPDTIHDFTMWSAFGPQLLIENMDRRKTDGRTARELAVWFDRLPQARLCFDLAHAQHFDPTMTEAFQILTQFSDRICQVHISELDSASRHFSLSSSALQAFADVTWKIPKEAAYIIESRIQPDEIDSELHKVLALVSHPEPALA